MTGRRITSSLAAALAAMAVAAPAANAVPDFPLTPADKSADSTPAAAPPETVRVPGPTVVVEAGESSGFDWGSAGIGAGGGIVLLLLAGAGVATVGRHHGRMGAVGR